MFGGGFGPGVWPISADRMPCGGGTFSLGDGGGANVGINLKQRLTIFVASTYPIHQHFDTLCLDAPNEYALLARRMEYILPGEGIQGVKGCKR